MTLLADAGLALEQASERSLVLRSRDAPIDVLLVRAADVPEYVQDGVVDCGITGEDLVMERTGTQLITLLRLGFGRCKLEVAVPQESPIRELGEIAGHRVATVFPQLTRRMFEASGIDCELIEITGSVEIAPRLGLAEAISDLVSSGSTLRTNGLRSIARLFESQAVLVAREEHDPAVCRLTTMLRSVVDARGARYLMFNAPKDALDEIVKVVPSGKSPSVLPLADPGMVAIHTLVQATSVWELLPKLEAAGASSILILPVERMLG